MNQGQIERIREEAVFEFLSENEGSSLISYKTDWALISVGGLTADQRKFHGWMILCTLGLWTPLFLVVRLLRTHHHVVIRVWKSGYVERVIL